MLKHPSALDGHTHSTALTHTVPKHTGPSSCSFIPWVGTPHVCAPHTIPSTIVDFCGHACAQFQQSPIFHLIVIDFAPAHRILGPSPPNSTLLSNFYRHSTPLSIFAHTHICLLLIVINSTSAQCLWATTIHPPPVFPPLHHRSVVAHATHVLHLLHCGLGCPLPMHGWVGVLVVLGDGLGSHGCVAGSSCPKFFFSSILD